MKRIAAVVVIVLGLSALGLERPRAQANAPSPLLKAGQSVDWWFVFKFNTKSFPECGGPLRACPFGGTPKAKYAHRFGQQFAYASSADHELKKGVGCVGDTSTDPVGATFGDVYNGDYNYVVWNDQFYAHPKLDCASTTGNCASPWGHSKGMLAWNDDGKGVVMQVSTPSWPGAASNDHPRTGDGNTLGCVEDNDVLVSQHFFSLKLSKEDVVSVLDGLVNASAVTDPSKIQIVRTGGPTEIRSAVAKLGVKSTNKGVTKTSLSSGVILISKSSGLHVPPWQMVSSLLGGVSLRTATWWANPQIPSTTKSTKIKCWDDSLTKKPGPVQIATSGSFDDELFGLVGSATPNGNHAKIGISTSGSHAYSIFGDLNQQGSLSGPNCASSQNGRGGLFFVVDDQQLHDSIHDLIAGDSAPTKIVH